MTSSEKLKVLLQDKETQCRFKIKKLKNKMKIIKILSISISVSTIVIMAAMASTLILSPTIISILSAISAILIGIDSTFKFRDKSLEKKILIDKLNIIQTKLEYINSCNGNLTEVEYLQIFKEFNTVL